MQASVGKAVKEDEMRRKEITTICDTLTFYHEDENST